MFAFIFLSQLIEMESPVYQSRAGDLIFIGEEPRVRSKAYHVTMSL